MSLNGRNIVSIQDLTKSEIQHIFEVAQTMEPLTESGSNMLQSKILACLFFEPSTRTRLSFESAMNRLGGRCISIADSKTSSIEKGESLEDTIRVVQNYADIIVLRHPLENAIKRIAEIASIPIINAGSGAGEHPTQALLDLYTMKRELGKIDGLDIAFLGDLKYGRTVHSLIFALALYDVNLYLISPPLLKMPRKILKKVNTKIKVTEICDLDSVISNIDVLYVTRVQKERLPDLEDYKQIEGTYRITSNTLYNAKKNMILMHPLPRVHEIAPEVDFSPHSIYFKEVWYGVVTRMALLSLVLGIIK